MSKQTEASIPPIEQIRKEAKKLAAEENIPYRDALKTCLGAYLAVETAPEARNRFPGDYEKTMSMA